MGCSSLREITIPNSVTTIGSKVFQDCSSLKNITLSEGITTIPEYSFDNCSSLESFIIPESVSSIGERAFRGCSSMRTINLPNALTSLPKYAFHGCSSLESISIPSSITFINQFCFYNCSSITSVISLRVRVNLESQKSLWHCRRNMAFRFTMFVISYIGIIMVRCASAKCVVYVFLFQLQNVLEGCVHGAMLSPYLNTNAYV